MNFFGADLQNAGPLEVRACEGLEAQAQSEAERALIAGRFAAGIRDAIDDHELTATDVRARIGKMRRIAAVQRLRAELHVPLLGHPEVAEQPKIEVHQPRPAQCIKTSRAKSRIGH